jgi:hypothetical protein
MLMPEYPSQFSAIMTQPHGRSRAPLNATRH